MINVEGEKMIFTYCRGQYREAISVQQARTIERLLHTLLDPISICNRSIPNIKTMKGNFSKQDGSIHIPV